MCGNAGTHTHTRHTEMRATQLFVTSQAVFNDARPSSLLLPTLFRSSPYIPCRVPLLTFQFCVQRRLMSTAEGCWNIISTVRCSQYSRYFFSGDFRCGFVPRLAGGRVWLRVVTSRFVGDVAALPRLCDVNFAGVYRNAA